MKFHVENMEEQNISAYKSSQMYYCVEVMAQLNMQRQRETFCDVTIIVEGREFKTHRSVLSAASPYFDSMFTCNMKEQGQDSVCLEGICVPTMEYALEFMYTGDVQINQENAYDVMATANYLLLESLKNQVVAFLQESLDIPNCIQTYYFAVKYECQDLLCSAREFINSNFVSVCETEDFLALTHDQVKEWISSDDIIIGGEKDVFEVVLKWVESDESGTRENYFQELFQSIRLSCVSHVYFFSAIITNKLVRENLECCHVALDAAREMAHLSGEYLSRQQPRKCLEKYYDGIIVCGERRTLCYVPSQNSWYKLKDRSGGGNHLRVCSYRGCVYSPVERYDPMVNGWLNIAKPPQHNDKYFAFVSLLGYLYQIGGKIVQRFDRTYRYDPDSNSWQQVASLSSPRSSVCAVSDNKFIYAIGGINSGDAYLNTVDRFDPAANAWTSLAPMAMQRAGACGAFLRENIFVFGGTRSNTYLKICEKYSCVMNQWQVISNMHVPRCHASAVAFGDTIYVFGGLTTEAAAEHKFESYDPGSDEWEWRGTVPIYLGSCSAGALRICKTLLRPHMHLDN